MRRREAKGVEGSGLSGTGSAPRSPSHDAPAVMSRRQALGRFSKGAVAAGVAAWVTPEILLAMPTAAGALSAPPTSPGGGGGGSNPPGSGSITGGGSGGAVTPVIPGNTSSAASKAASPSTAAGSGGTLPFTGFDAERAAEIAGGLIAGGWALTRWASREPKVAPADGGELPGDQSPHR
jgi:hypothetical protein